jgi:tetratricopeptide (TPR) repeat protein
VLPGHGGVAPNIGHWVVQETYDGLIKKKVGLETPFLDGASELAGEGLLEEALFYVNKALAEEGENLEAHELKALLLNDLGRPQEALEAFDQILAKKPDQEQMILGKGCSLMGLGRYDESLSLFDEVLKNHPQSSQAQIYKGMALYLAERLDEAMDLPAFQQAFTSHLKTELEKLAQEKKREAGS